MDVFPVAEVNGFVFEYLIVFMSFARYEQDIAFLRYLQCFPDGLFPVRG